MTQTARSEATFRGYEALAVSRTDNVRAAAAGDATAWKSPALISKQSAATFSDKEQIWADNAATSPYFGNIYLCSADFRSNSQGNALPTPLYRPVAGRRGHVEHDAGGVCHR